MRYGFAATGLALAVSLAGCSSSGHSAEKYSGDGFVFAPDNGYQVAVNCSNRDVSDNSRTVLLPPDKAANFGMVAASVVISSGYKTYHLLDGVSVRQAPDNREALEVATSADKPQEKPKESIVNKAHSYVDRVAVGGRVITVYLRAQTVGSGILGTVQCGR